TTPGNRRRSTPAPRTHGSDERRERGVRLRQGVPPHPQQSGVLFQALPRRPPALIGSRRLCGEIVQRPPRAPPASAVALSWPAVFAFASRRCAPRTGGRIRSIADAPDRSCVTSAPWVSGAARAELTQIQADLTSRAIPFFGSSQPATRQLWEDAETRDARGDA